MGCSCQTPVCFLLEVSTNGLTVGSHWFGLIFKASFPHLGKVVASHTVQSSGEHGISDGTGEPDWRFRAMWLGWVGLDHG